jgi:outer membrane protein TolC
MTQVEGTLDEQTSLLEQLARAQTRAEAHRHALRNLRGRSLGFVRIKLKPLIDEALDALEGNPPFADVALHRLQSIKARISEEDTWLALLDWRG